MNQKSIMDSLTDELSTEISKMCHSFTCDVILNHIRKELILKEDAIMILKNALERNLELAKQ